MKKLALALFALAMTSYVLPAEAAITCRARQKVCQNFCAKTWKSTTSSCATSCADALPRCLQDGCWVVPMSSKCGYVKS